MRVYQFRHVGNEDSDYIVSGGKVKFFIGIQSDQQRFYKGKHNA